MNRGPELMGAPEPGHKKIKQETGPAEVDNDWSGRTSGFYWQSTERLQGVQWCIAINRGGYTLEMRPRRCRASTFGARIGAEGSGFLGRGCPPPQTTRRLGGASWAPPAGSGAEPRPPTHSRHISAPQKPSSRRLLKFSGPEIYLVQTMHYGVYGSVKCEKLLAVPSAN